MSVIAISQQAPCAFGASRSMKIGFAHFRTQDQPVTPTIHVLSLTVTLKGSLYITFGPRFSRNFLFAFENGTIIHPSRPSQHRENDLPSGALPTICHPHQYSPKLPFCPLLLQHLSLPQPVYRRITQQARHFQPLKVDWRNQMG